MLHSYLLVFSVILFGCLSEDPIGGVEKDNIIIEIEDDDDWNSKAVPILERNVNDIIQRGIDSSEPIHLDVIDGTVGTLRYKANDVNVFGVNTCKVQRSKFNKDALSMIIQIKCTRMKLVGLYEASGQIIAVPIEGKGDFVMTADDYFVTVNCGLKKYEGKDGKTHLKTKNYSLNMQLQGAISFRLNNLFNGNEKLSDATHKFLNNNYKAVADLTQDSIWYPCVKVVLKNTNKYLKTVPYEEIIFN